MIDWVSCRIPVTLPAPIHDGHTAFIDREGNVVRATPMRLKVSGSFSSSLVIRAPGTSELELSGNPVKWLAGHNLYGSDDLKALLWATLQRLAPVLGGDLAAIGLHGPDALDNAIVTRVDCTEMFTLPDRLSVLSWLRSAYAAGSVSHRGRGLFREGSLVFGHAAGKSMARWQIVLYSKGQEVEAHPLPDLLKDDDDVASWVSQQLRCEVRLGRLELEKQELRRLGNWRRPTAGLMWKEKMAQITFSELREADDKLAALPSNLAGVYALWTKGLDLRAIYSKSAFYRYRLAIQQLTGIDIAVPAPSQPVSNVVPLRRTLEAVHSGRPPWADRIDAALEQQGCIVLRA